MVGVTDRIVALGFLCNLYRDKKVCITVGNVGGFSLSDPCFLRQGSHIVDFFGESGCIFLSWWAAPFPLLSSSRGVVGAPVCLPQESRRSVLVCTADRWAKAHYQ
jgi:hypothetical protein